MQTQKKQLKNILFCIVSYAAVRPAVDVFLSLLFCPGVPTISRISVVSYFLFT
jgi:hypothetical protein